MKKILILGLIFAAVGCSKEPKMDEINKAAALAVLKGSYTTERGTAAETAFSGIDIAVGTAVTIDSLEFSITTTDAAKPVAFEYITIEGNWIMYKATYNGVTKYTAFNTSTTSLLIEGDTFRATQAEVTTDGETGTPFLAKA